MDSTANAHNFLDGDDPTLGTARALAEIHAIRQALQRTDWNRKQAAQILKISYRGLLYKIRRYNIHCAQPSDHPRFDD
jgi:transcriptional regulator with GAF, ATPase, and Fis domain